MSATRPTRNWTPRLVAETLLDCEANAVGRASFIGEWPAFDVEAAYLAQDIALDMRRARGEVVVGVKLGLTSRAKQQQMGVHEPSVAWLTDVMELPSATPVPLHRMIHPRAEPEIVLVLGRELKGPGVTAASAMAAVSHVMAAVEIIDSRFTGFEFSLPDVIADNNSSSGYITGPVQVTPDGLDLAMEGCLLEVNGRVVDSASGAAILGNPAHALAFAANKVAERGHALQPGWVVLTGGLTEAISLAPASRIAAHFTHLGSVVVSGG